MLLLDYISAPNLFSEISYSARTPTVCSEGKGLKLLTIIRSSCPSTWKQHTKRHAESKLRDHCNLSERKFFALAMLKHVIKENVTLVYSLSRIRLRYKMPFSRDSPERLHLRSSGKQGVCSMCPCEKHLGFLWFLFKLQRLWPKQIIFMCSFTFCLLWDRVSWSSGWSSNYYVAKTGLELLVFLYWPSKCRVRGVSHHSG